MKRKKPRKKKPRAPGPKPSVTLEVVKRVSERVGRGMPLVMALEAEGAEKVNLETWKKALQSHPELSPHYAAARGKFLELAMRRLEASEDLKHLMWLLERRHSDLFCRPADNVVNVTNNVGIPADVLERARQLAVKSAPKPNGK